MLLDELAQALFPRGHELATSAAGIVSGTGTSAAGAVVGVVGITGGHALGVDEALVMSRLVLDHVARKDAGRLLMLVDTQSQKMARRDELLGLNECLAHLCKSLALASRVCGPTIGILYGAAAAGAFIATALSTGILVAVPGAAPSVMDLASIARVTKLPLERLEEMSRTTPIFAPGLEHLAATGAVAETWDDERGAYAERLDALLSRPNADRDDRDQLGEQREGRLKASIIARRVMNEAVAATR